MLHALGMMANQTYRNLSASHKNDTLSSIRISNSRLDALISKRMVRCTVYRLDRSAFFWIARQHILINQPRCCWLRILVRQHSSEERNWCRRWSGKPFVAWRDTAVDGKRSPYYFACAISGTNEGARGFKRRDELGIVTQVTISITATRHRWWWKHPSFESQLPSGNAVEN